MADIEWAMLCDYAFQDAGRKTCLIGIFDRIFTKAVPAQHNQASFAFKLTGDANEEVDFKIEINRPSGGVIGGLSGKLKIPPAGTLDMIAQLQGFPLPDWGAYSFNLYIGSSLAKTVGLTVAQTPKANQPPPPSS